MFDIAWTEFLVIAVVALVVVGPRDLPALLRTIGKTVANIRRMAGEFQGQFNEAMREAELDDLKREVTGLKDQASKVVGKNPFQIARDELKSAMEDKPRPAPSALSGEAKRDVADDVPSAFAPPPVAAPAFSGAEFAPTPEKPAAKKAPAKRAKAADGATAATPNGASTTKAAKAASAKAAAKAPAAAKPAAGKAAAKKPVAGKPAASEPDEQPARPTPPGAAA